MESKTFIGIDISSATLDICVNIGDQKVSHQIKNAVKAVRKFFLDYNSTDVIIAMENTGRYNWTLYEVLADMACQVYVISPLHMKKSMGLIRDKNDKIDAVRICRFIEKNYKELKVWKCPSKSIQSLKVLLTERTQRIKMRGQLKAHKADYAKMKKLGLDKNLLTLNEQMVASLNKQIQLIEKKIQGLIEDDEALKHQFKLIVSIPGVGKILGWTILAKTHGFTLIDTARKMACYSGIAPFSHQSGTSIRGKHRVSSFADKSLKTLFHLSAMSAIRLNNDMGAYYRRRIENGKNKMSVLNAVRNKIIHRIYAVIKNQTPYSLVLS